MGREANMGWKYMHLEGELFYEFNHTQIGEWCEEGCGKGVELDVERWYL